MGTFDFEGTKVYAVPDFAYRDPEGVVRILDWKTGRGRPEHRLQLAIYFLYAEATWGCDPERTLGIDVYLDEGGWSEHEFDAADLDRVRAELHDSLEAMRALHFDADEEEGDRERFPMVDPGSRECASCNYRELCGRS
jgi:CRISPR/Cas system-associated exonuclease Cas4 (RecB family)